MVILQTISLLVMWLAIAIVAMKVVWNIGLPYAMLLESLRRKPELGERGWSVFPLIELLPLAGAAIASVLADVTQMPSGWMLFWYGAVAIALSYFHFAIVGGICGFLVHLIKGRGRRFDKQEGGRNHE